MESSATARVIVVEPVFPPSGSNVTVRFVPLPARVIFSGRTSSALLELAVTTSWSAGVSGSPITNGMGAVA